MHPEIAVFGAAGCHCFTRAKASNAYYAAFSTCEHKLNKGGLTPFVIAYCEIVTHAARSSPVCHACVAGITVSSPTSP